MSNHTSLLPGEGAGPEGGVAARPSPASATPGTPASHFGSMRSRPRTLDVTTMEHPYGEDADRADPRPVPRQEVFKHQISDLKEEISQLNQALDSHAVIDQAIGVVSAVGGLEPERGLQVLTEVSQHTNIKLRRVAEHVVAWAHSQELSDVIRQALDAALTRNTAS
jgi:hypothetical protein